MMTKILQFEQLNVWKSARIFVNLVYEKTKSNDFSRDFALRDQIRKSAISVMSNIAEGFDARNDNEFIRFLGYSFRSLAEAQSQLYTALDQGYINKIEFQESYDQATDVRKQIRGLVNYLRSNKHHSGTIKEPPATYAVNGSADFNFELDLPAELTSMD